MFFYLINLNVCFFILLSHEFFLLLLLAPWLCWTVAFSQQCQGHIDRSEIVSTCQDRIDSKAASPAAVLSILVFYNIESI